MITLAGNKKVVHVDQLSHPDDNAAELVTPLTCSKKVKILLSYTCYDTVREYAFLTSCSHLYLKYFILNLSTKRSSV